MATTLGEPVGPEHAVPPARRASTPGWRDPRLWVGVVIVAASVVGGARLMASVDDTVSVWAVSDDLAEGTRLRAEDLRAQRVRFADGADLEHYLLTDTPLPEDAQLTRPVSAGELLARSALGGPEESDLHELPLAVEPEQVPPSVEKGSVVDVYVLDPGARPRSTGAEPVLEAVTVVEAPPLSESFGTSGGRQLVVAVSEEAARSFFTLLGAAEAPVLTVVRRG